MDSNLNKIDIIYSQTTDEFNYTSSVNFFKKISNDTAIVCASGFEVMFYNFDWIIPISCQTGFLLSDDNNLKSEVSKNLNKEGTKIKEKCLTQYDLPLDGVHVYEFVFRNLAREMFEKNKELYCPKKTDHEYVKSKLSAIDKKIITINGRNLGGIRNNRNNLLEGLISFLINKGVFVINCTLPNPKLSEKYSSDFYLEIDELELFDYSKNISYFLNSNCLVTVSDSGGVTNHICTKSNIILFGGGGWVDNNHFGFEGKSMYEISKQIKPTFQTTNFDEILEIVNSLEKPEVNNFFDETKIINLDEL